MVVVFGTKTILAMKYALYYSAKSRYEARVIQGTR